MQKVCPNNEIRNYFFIPILCIKDAQYIEPYIWDIQIEDIIYEQTWFDIPFSLHKGWNKGAIKYLNYFF